MARSLLRRLRADVAAIDPGERFHVWTDDLPATLRNDRRTRRCVRRDCDVRWVIVHGEPRGCHGVDPDDT